MKYAEVIYETGSKAVVSYDKLDELKEGLAEQHNRAVTGEAGGPLGHNAERVNRVFLYDDHPGESSGLVNVAEAKRILGDLAVGDQISAAEVTEALRDAASPVYTEDLGRHESNYKADGKELTLDFLEA